MDCRPLRTTLFFEELEPRLLYSADLAGVVDTGAPEQDVEEESAITADLESTEESDAAQQEEDEENAPSTLSTEPMEPAEESGSSAGDVGAVEEKEEMEEAAGTGSLPDTAAEETSPTDPPPASSAGEDNDSNDSNAAPVVTMPDTAVSYAPGDPPAILAPDATVGDDDSDDFKQGTLTVSISQGGTDDDQLLIVEGGDVSLLNNNIKVEQKLVGSFVGGSDGAALVISWSPQATPAYAEAVLRQIAYSHDSADPAPVSRTIDFVLTDGEGGTSNTVQAIIGITGTAAPGGDTGGAEVTLPIDEPSNNPVDGKDDPPEPIAPGGGQNNPEGGQEKPGGTGDDAGALTPPVPPASDPGGLENAEFTAAGSGSADFLPATGNWRDEPYSPQELREKDDEVGRVETEDHAGQERVAPDAAGPRSDGSAEYDEMEGGFGFSLLEQPIAPVVQGQETGDPHEATLSETLKTTMSRLLGFFTPSAATASLAPPLTPDPAASDTATNNEMVCREVEVMRQEMEEAFLQSNRAGKLMAYTTTGASLSLAAGIARYFFHSGSLLSGFLATIPLWKGFDPVAVLRTPKNDWKKGGATSPSAGVETIEQKAETMFAAGGDA